MAMRNLQRILFDCMVGELNGIRNTLEKETTLDYVKFVSITQSWWSFMQEAVRFWDVTESQLLYRDEVNNQYDRDTGYNEGEDYSEEPVEPVVAAAQVEDPPAPPRLVG